jgi:DNA modification methylase
MIDIIKDECKNKSLINFHNDNNILINADCMNILSEIPNKSVQLILAGLPVGSTCKAAKDLNRKFIEIEKETKYYNIAVEYIFKK